MSRLVFQGDNIEKGFVLENQVVITKLCIMSDEVAKHSARDSITSRVIEQVKNSQPSKIYEQFKPCYTRIINNISRIMSSK